MTNDNEPVEGYDVITGSKAVIEGTMAITIKEYNELVAEIEQLRVRIDDLIADRDAERKMYNEGIASHLAEIERLRGHKEEADRHIKTIAELRKEIEKLELLAVNRLIEIDQLKKEIEELQRWA